MSTISEIIFISWLYSFGFSVRKYGVLNFNFHLYLRDQFSILLESRVLNMRKKHIFQLLQKCSNEACEFFHLFQLLVEKLPQLELIQWVWCLGQYGTQGINSTLTDPTASKNHPRRGYWHFRRVSETICFTE